jgi:hypothetical protein
MHFNADLSPSASANKSFASNANLAQITNVANLDGHAERMTHINIISVSQVHRR